MVYDLTYANLKLENYIKQIKCIKSLKNNKKIM